MPADPGCEGAAQIRLLTEGCFGFTIKSAFYCGLRRPARRGGSWVNASPMKQPSALLPIAMSVAALALVLGHVAIFGAVREADEGTTAHLWQLLMAGQAPVVAYFALKWLRRAPGQALRVLALQVVAALAACAPVYWLKL
jgi:hypothetical protein